MSLPNYNRLTPLILCLFLYIFKTVDYRIFVIIVRKMRRTRDAMMLNRGATTSRIMDADNSPVPHDVTAPNRLLLPLSRTNSNRSSPRSRTNSVTLFAAHPLVVTSISDDVSRRCLRPSVDAIRRCGRYDNTPVRSHSARESRGTRSCRSSSSHGRVVSGSLRRHDSARSGRHLRSLLDAPPSYSDTCMHTHGNSLAVPGHRSAQSRSNEQVAADVASSADAELPSYEEVVEGHYPLFHSMQDVSGTCYQFTFCSRTRILHCFVM